MNQISTNRRQAFQWTRKERILINLIVEPEGFLRLWAYTRKSPLIKYRMLVIIILGIINLNMIFNKMLRKMN